MDFKNFVLHKDDGESYVIGHPNGKSLQINKRGLSEKAHEVIAKLPKYADGTPDGGVPSAQDIQLQGLTNPGPSPLQNFIATQQAGPQDAFSKAINDRDDAARAAQTAPAAITADEIGQIPQQPEVASNIPGAGIPTDASTSAPAGVSGGEAAIGNIPAPNAPAGQQVPGLSSPGFGQEKAGNIAEAKAKGEQGQNESNEILKAQAAEHQLPSQSDIIAQNNDKEQALRQAYIDKKIDPNHYWANQSTGSKIAAGIGLLFSGFGAGAAHQTNFALDQINRAVENDISAQQNEQGKAKNLWQMNREALGTDLAANLATRQQIYTGLQYSLQKAASDAKTPLAAAQAQIANGQIQQKIDQLKYNQSFANGPTQETAGGAAPGSEQANSNHLNMLQRGVQLGVVKPEVVKDAQDRTLPGIGIARIMPTPDDRQELTNYDTLGKYLNQAKAFQQSGPGANIGAWSPGSRQQAAVIQQNITNSLNQLLDSKRPASKELYDRYSKVIGSPGSFDIFGKNAAGLNQMAQDVGTRRNTMLTSLGVTPFAKAPANAVALEWAKQNKGKDARADSYLQQNGMH